MSNQSIRVQARLLFFLILLNFVAQVPYFIHLYIRTQPLSTTLRSALIMGAVFAFFMIASVYLFKGRSPGYPLMLVFLAVEFLFYFGNLINSLRHGYAPFFQVNNPDLTLRIIYSIGYLNLFASAYFLYLLLFHPDPFRPLA